MGRARKLPSHAGPSLLGGVPQLGNSVATSLSDPDYVWVPGTKSHVMEFPSPTIRLYSNGAYLSSLTLTVECPNVTLLQSENDLFEPEIQPNSHGNC